MTHKVVHMNKNRIGLHILFALLGLGASLLFLGLGGQFIMHSYENYYQPSDDLIVGGVFSGLGLICLIFSIALMQRLNWARIAFQVLLLLGGIAWLIFMAFLAQDSPRTWAIVAGMGAAGIMIVVFGVLFLENIHFIEDLQQEQNEDKEHLDILDR